LQIQAKIGSLAWQATESMLTLLFVPLLSKPFLYAQCYLPNGYLNSKHREN